MEVEQMPNMSNEEKVSAPTPVDLTPEVKKEKSSKNGYIVGILLFLIICLIGGLTYYVLKDNGIDLLSSTKQTDEIEEVEDNDSETTEQKNVDTTICEETDSNCDLSVDNKGWGLFSIPEYGFSVEIPSYTMSQNLESENIQSRWSAWFNTDPKDKDGYDWEYLLSNNIGTVYLRFYPVRIPESLGCGFGCVKEHIIYTNIYENKNDDSLENIMSKYRSAWEDKYTNEDVKSTNLKGEIVSKWGNSVWSFSASTEGGTWYGYLLTSGDYIYEVKYMLSTTPIESVQTAQKVLDSMKFEQ